MKKNIIRQAQVKKILVVGNWKMNPETAEKAKEIFKGTKNVAKDLKNTKVVVCPPFVYLSDLEKLADSKLILGAQDVFWEKSGSFTGEIGSAMLSGESYVIIGHSERRELGETDAMVAKKIISAIKAGLKPILCIGEKVRDEHGEYLHFLRSQIINSLGKLSKKDLKKIVIAYEPVWAIGKNDEEAMRPGDIHETTIFIKKVLAEIYSSKEIIPVPILYGGSVGPENAKDIIEKGEVAGLLVGHVSLNFKKFGELLKNVDQI
jgi:triosephosphate isomerase